MNTKNAKFLIAFLGIAIIFGIGIVLIKTGKNANTSIVQKPPSQDAEGFEKEQIQENEQAQENIGSIDGEVLEVEIDFITIRSKEGEELRFPLPAEEGVFVGERVEQDGTVIMLEMALFDLKAGDRVMVDYDLDTKEALGIVSFDKRMSELEKAEDFDPEIDSLQ